MIKIDFNNLNISKLSIDDAQIINEILSIEDEQNVHILTKSAILDDISNPNYYYYVLSLNNNVLGYIAFSYIIDTINVISIVIKKDYQNNKLGSFLLNYLICFSDKNNVDKILLEVAKSNTYAISLYNKFNFKQIHIREKYYNNIEDALILERTSEK